jgi:hypothetical protein
MKALEKCHVLVELEDKLLDVVILRYDAQTLNAC